MKYPQPTKAQIEESNRRKAKKEVNRDIDEIDSVLQNNNETDMRELHRKLDGKYQAAIKDWGKSMYGYIEKHGFSYECLDVDSIRENLLTMKPKLEAFAQGWNIAENATRYTRNSEVSVTVNNTVNITISFEEARKQIEEMTALSQEQTEEIIEKINELENISKEDTSRKTKWEKIKPIIEFTLDKGVDVAIAILSLVGQMKLGM